MRDGELDPSTLRRPQALRTDAPRNRITAEPRNRVLLPVALCLTLLAAPLLLVKSATGRGDARPTVRTVADRTVALNSAVAQGYGVPDGILTASDLAAASADGATASGASAAGGGSAGAQAHIASVGPPSPVTAPESSVSAASPPTTSAPPTTRPPSPTTTAAPATTTTRAPAGSSTSSSARSEQGPASWYDAPAGTCAHPSLPFGTVVTVENLATGATTTCRVEDRGPYQGGRIIDLSEQSFSQIAPTSDGVIQVRISW
jgi:rare lipoprotein A